jgi:hypothetical protein
VKSLVLRWPTLILGFSSMPARPARRSFEPVQMTIDPSAVARADGWNVGFRNRTVVSGLRWAVLIPTAALGFMAAAALGHSGSKADPPASFFGPASTATAAQTSARLGNERIADQP